MPRSECELVVFCYYMYPGIKLIKLSNKWFYLLSHLFSLAYVLSPLVIPHIKNDLTRSAYKGSCLNLPYLYRLLLNFWNCKIYYSKYIVVFPITSVNSTSVATEFTWKYLHHLNFHYSRRQWHKYSCGPDSFVQCCYEYSHILLTFLPF